MKHYLTCPTSIQRKKAGRSPIIAIQKANPNKEKYTQQLVGLIEGLESDYAKLP